MVITEKSSLQGIDQAKNIEALINRGENVIILSNHQTEADPQVISILLESVGLGSLAERIIYVAGHKVTSDPVAIPFSMVSTIVYKISWIGCDDRWGVVRRVAI